MMNQILIKDCQTMNFSSDYVALSIIKMCNDEYTKLCNIRININYNPKIMFNCLCALNNVKNNYIVNQRSVRKPYGCYINNSNNNSSNS